MKILDRLLGRMKMAINTMEKHSDRQVRLDNALRAQCYQTAFDDVQNDEEVQAAYELALRVHTYWEMDKLQAMSAEDYIALRPLLAKFSEKMRRS